MSQVDPERQKMFRPVERGERTRISAHGELSFHIGSLMEVLRTQHLISQMDRILEFAAPNIPVPKVFGSRDIDSVSVILGELHTKEDVEAGIAGHDETHITVRLRSGNEALVINRTSDPALDPRDGQDYIAYTDPSELEVIKTVPLESNVSRIEFNAILVGLVASDAESLAKFNDTDFLDPSLFLALGDELEETATHKQVTGIHNFNDDNSELEFEQIDRHESFKFTHTTIENGIPRSFAAAASSSVQFSMQFFVAKGRDVRTELPDSKDVELLKDIALAELAALRTHLQREVEPETQSISIDGSELQVTTEPYIQRIDQKIDHTLRVQKAANDLYFQDLLEGAALDQDSFDTPDTGAA